MTTLIQSWPKDLLIIEFITDSIKIGTFDKTLINIKLFLNLTVDKKPTVTDVTNKTKKPEYAQ